MGADPDHPIALFGLNVKAKLATVYDLAQDGPGPDLGAFKCSGDVLYANLEANRRLVVCEVRLHAARGGALSTSHKSRR